MGRKRIHMPFKEARAIVRLERIESVAQYKKWHELNNPISIPKRPDRIYDGEFISWNDYLGNNNPFPIIKHAYRPYNEAKAFAQSLNISTRREWFDMCDEEKKPKDIPRRPDLFYRKVNEWVSWGNFLGVTLAARAHTVEEMKTIFFIVINPKAAKNYFKCGITNGGLSSINDLLRKINGRVVCTYYVPQIFDYVEFLTSLGAVEDYEHESYYKITNLTPILSKLSLNFNRAA
jgi:hypothetical protein